MNLYKKKSKENNIDDCRKCNLSSHKVWKLANKEVMMITNDLRLRICIFRFISNHGRHAVNHGPNLSEIKVGLAVQFVSNCHSTSKREAYVRELKQFIPIDVYGKCKTNLQFNKSLLRKIQFAAIFQ